MNNDPKDLGLISHEEGTARNIQRWYHGTTGKYDVLKKGTWFASTLSEALLFLRMKGVMGYIAVVEGKIEDLGSTHVVDPDHEVYHLFSTKETIPVEWMTSSEAMQKEPGLVRNLFSPSTVSTDLTPRV